jgi:hypothetical protein
MYNGTITVTSPSLPYKDGDETSGTLSLKGYTPTGKSKDISIHLAIVENLTDYTSAPANCYVASKPATRYLFNPMVGGSKTPVATTNLRVIWETTENLIQYLDMRDGVASFYIAGYQEDDNSEEEDNIGVKAGNALIGGYDEANNLVWSWHIWVTNNDPTATDNTITLNGETLMNINLGADCNSEGSADGKTIFNSYGLYYQWGRKDPFPRPLYFDATGAYDEDRYDKDGVYITEVFAERTAENGTLDYVTKNPMHFILNASCIEEGGDGVGDWLATADNNLWNDTAKSLYDPCPYGWRVPTADELKVLQLSDD